MSTPEQIQASFSAAEGKLAQGLSAISQAVDLIKVSSDQLGELKRTLVEDEEIVQGAVETLADLDKITARVLALRARFPGAANGQDPAGD